jgi:transcriptional regulator with XRE-family HTH domain
MAKAATKLRTAASAKKAAPRGWPRGVKLTPASENMFARFASLPEGLTREQLGKKLRVSKHQAAKWAEAFKYQTVNPQDMRRNIYDNVDWSKTDAQIAREVGRTAQAVGYQRRQQKQGRSDYGRVLVDARKLQKLREAAGLKRAQLGRLAGINVMKPWYLEEGINTRATESDLKAMAKVLKVKPEELMGKKDWRDQQAKKK